MPCQRHREAGRTLGEVPRLHIGGQHGEHEPRAGDLPLLLPDYGPEKVHGQLRMRDNW